jgi:mersacidin/lichenicidin family type 2 lantibiotic
MMNNLSVIRAWKDEEYRLNLSEAERALLPPHPAGLIELADGELNHAAGAAQVPILTCLGGGGLCTWLDCALSIKCPRTQRCWP